MFKNIHHWFNMIKISPSTWITLLSIFLYILLDYTPLFTSIFIYYNVQMTGSILCIIRWLKLYWLTNTGVSMCGSSQRNSVSDLVSAAPTVSNMSNLSYLDGLWDGREVTVQLLSCGVQFPGFVKDSRKHPCIVLIQLFLLVRY